MKKAFAWFLFVCMIIYMPAIAEDATGLKMANTAIDLTGIIIAVVGLIFNFLIAWLGKKIVPPLKKWLEEKTTAEQRQAMWNVITKLVEAAEQVIGAGKGAEKLQYVKDALLAAGYSVDADLIEAAVKEMNDKALSTFEVGFADEEQAETEKTE